MIGTHFLKALSVCSADKVRLHIVYTALRIHQILIVLTFYLDHAHDHAVDHVDRFTFVFLAFTTLFVVLNALIVLFKVVLNALTAIVIRIISVVLKRSLPLIKTIILYVLLVKHILLLLMAFIGARLEPNIIHLWIVELVLLLPSIVVILLILHIVIVQVCRLGLLTQQILVHSMPAMLTTLIQENWIRYWPLSLTF